MRRSAACMGHGGIGYTATGKQLLATGTGKAGRTPAAVPAHVDIENACKCDSARHCIGAGSPCCVRWTADYAAWGSREGRHAEEQLVSPSM